MNIGKFLKNFVFFGSVFYTVISTGFIFIASLLSESQSAMILETDRFMCILLFSFIMSLGSTILRVDEINRVAAVCLHAACYILGFLVFMLLSGTKFAPAIIATAIFAVVYIVSTIICRLISRIGKKAPEAPKIIPENKQISKPDKEYKSQFTK